ncbi:MAG: aminopeptidase, partial [Euryarchaeota archaeon]|nr:aminopeptidase [Euryarchaeota archaeon]
MGKVVTKTQISKYRKAFNADPAARVAQNAVSNAELTGLALSRELVQNMDFSFSTKLDDWEVTAQMRSGRCWL